MIFWDTSAIVPLCVRESASSETRRIVTEDPSIVVWWATRTECISAFARRRREGGFSAENERRARRVLSALSQGWSEIQPAVAVRERAERLLDVHTLGAADAFQLAAALLWVRDRTQGRGFVSLDAKLRIAAGREGFDLLPG